MAGNAVGWFEIPVTDMARAKRFYEAVTGLTLTDMPMPSEGSMSGMEMCTFPYEAGAAGSSGALIKMDMVKPSAQPGLMIYFHSSDVSIELGRVEAAGGKIAMPKTSIGEHGFMGAMIDSEGNMVSFHSMA